jgi:hypothetical protein
MLGQFVTHDSVSGMVAQARQSRRPWLLLDGHEFRTAYNQRPFLVRHRLAEHPYFEYGALAALCRRLPIDQVRYRFGVIPSDAEFDTSLQRFRQGLTLDDAIDRMEERQAYIAIYNAEKDPEYRPVIEALLGELAAHSEAIDPGLNWYSTYIFVTAKDSVTPYHMDREMNFLLQIRGTKTVKLWDPHDDEIMNPDEKDRLLADRSQPLPTYKPSFERKAMIFDLVPGNGVHHPFLAPHLVTTGRQLSISLAITFRTHRSDVWTDAHCFNYRLRQRTKLALGTVGRFGVVDTTKAGFIRLTRKARRIFRTSRTPSEP